MMNMFNMNTGFGGFGTCGGFGNIFGGYNMIGNIFGGGFYNSCNGTYNYDAMAGFAVGSVLAQIGGNILGQFVSEKQQNSVKNLDANIDGLNKQIDAKVDELGCKNLEEARAYDIEKDDAGKKVATLNKELSDKKASFDKYEAYSVYRGIIDKYEEAQKKDPQPADIDQLKTAADDAKKALKEKEDLEKEIKKLEETTIPAAEKAKEARKKVIERIQNDIEDLVKQRDEIQGQKNEQILDKAAGNKYNRVSTTELNDKFTKKDDGSYEIKSEAEFTKRDFFRAITEYKTASEDKKEEWKNKIKLIYDNMSGDEKSAKIVEAFDTVMG